MEIINETFDVTLNNDNKTASINLNFSVTFKSSSAPSGKSITGTITTLTLTPYYPPRTLTISQGAGSNVSVQRTSSVAGASITTLYNGNSVYDGDVLKITFSASTGYNSSTCTVNSGTITSGSTYTVSGNVTIKSTAKPNTCILTLDVAKGSSITLYRQSSQGGSTGPLSYDATIYYDDVLIISFASDAEYNLSNCTVNGTTFTSGNTYKVSGNFTIASRATVKSYTLYINPDAYAEILVYRINSPLQGASNGGLSHGAKIYHSDVLEIEFNL